jgi:hypothetical protein
LTENGAQQIYQGRLREQDEWVRANKPYGERMFESAWTDCLEVGDYIDVLKENIITIAVDP